MNHDARDRDPDSGFASLLRSVWDAQDGVQIAPGARFGRYRIVRELGRGGQGRVFLADDAELPRRVAIKVLTALGPLPTEVAARFRREAEIAARLDHPGLCTVLDAGVHEGLPFLVMRYVEGTTLAECLERGRARGMARALLPEVPSTAAAAADALLRAFEKTALALDVAHAAGVVHRDLKPQNLLMASDGGPVVLDFGIAADLRAHGPTLTESGAVFGTPAYMAPEQVAGDRTKVDGRTDVFALAVCLYECLTAHRPFAAATREAVFTAVRTVDPEPVRRHDRSLPADLDVVLATALEKDPTRRYASARDFAEDLRRARCREPIRARPAGPVRRLRRWTQRHPAVAAAVALAFAFLAIGLAWTLHLLAATARERDAKATALDEVRRLSDLQRARDLMVRDDALWPAEPEQLVAMDRWLADAAALLERLPAQERALDDLRTRGDAVTVRPSPPIDEVGWRDASAPAPRVSWRFQDAFDQVRHDALSELVRLMAQLPRSIAAMRERREFAATVTQRSMADHAAAWLATIRAVQADPRFNGFVLTPQRGLVPLGRDPVSDLFEFAVLHSGTPPERGADGRIQLTPASALVLVLLPGGRFWMGAAAGAEAHNRIPHDEPACAPEHQVELSPFFISKFEMTQGQWLRLSGSNPSCLYAKREHEGVRYTWLHPVEQVSWRDCVTLLPRWNLSVPTEAQWEYACRGGTNTAFSTGDLPQTLRGYANVQDAGSSGTGQPGYDVEPEFADGWRFHAPVGSFAANPFGLHDVHGNVWEICLDFYRLGYPDPARPGDGLRQMAGADVVYRTCRGGAFNYPAFLAGSAVRNTTMPDFRYYTQGVRPARSLR